MSDFTAPSGRTYRWKQARPATQADIDKIVAFENDLVNREKSRGYKPGGLYDSEGKERGGFLDNLVPAITQASQTVKKKVKGKPQDPMAAAKVKTPLGEYQATDYASVTGKGTGGTDEDAYSFTGPSMTPADEKRRVAEAKRTGETSSMLGPFDVVGKAVEKAITGVDYVTKPVREPIQKAIGAGTRFVSEQVLPFAPLNFHKGAEEFGEFMGDPLNYVPPGIVNKVLKGKKGPAAVDEPSTTVVGTQPISKPKKKPPPKAEPITTKAGAGTESSGPSALGAKPVTVEGYRGVPAGSDPTKPGIGGGLFITPDEAVAKSYANGGTVAKMSVTFDKPLVAQNWKDAGKQLGLPHSATMDETLRAAKSAGHDGVVFKSHNGKPEYVSFKPPTSPATGPKKKGKTLQPRQESIAKVRKDTGRKPYEREVIGTKEAIDGGRKLHQEGHATKIAQDFKDGNIKALTGDQTVALDLRGNQLLDDIAKETDPSRIAQLDQELDDVLDALNKSGTRQSADFRARQLEYRKASDELVMMQRAQSRKPGGNLTDTERGEITRLSGEVKRLQSELSKVEAQAAITQAEKARKIATGKVKRATRLEESRAKHDAGVQYWKDNPITTDVVGAIPIPKISGKHFDAVKDIVKYRLEAGVYKIADLVDEVKKVAGGISDEDIYLAIRQAAGEHGAILNKGRALGEDIQVSGKSGIQSPEIADARIALDKAKKQAVEYVDNLRPPTKMEMATDIVNIPRALQSSGDVSTWFRQGAVLLASHPVKGAKAIAKSVKPTFSQKAAERLDDAIRNTDPDAHALREQAGLYLAPLNTLKAMKGEEAFIGRRLIEKVSGIGAVVKGSERNAVSFLNKLRADVFDQFAKANPEASIDELKDYADFINKATGRGSLGQFEQAASKLSTWFFSPRFMASRFQTPVKMLTAKGAARKQVIKDFGAYTGVISSTLMVAHLAGAKVELDPRSSDFLKIRIGKKVIDPLAGFAQVFRMTARVMRAGVDRANGRQPEDLRQIVEDFVKYKLSPQISIANELLTGEDAVGGKVTEAEALMNLLPLWIQETADMVKAGELNETEVGWMSALNFVGFGASEYKKKKLKPRPKMKR